MTKGKWDTSRKEEKNTRAILLLLEPALLIYCVPRKFLLHYVRPYNTKRRYRVLSHFVFRHRPVTVGLMILRSINNATVRIPKSCEKVVRHLEVVSQSEGLPLSPTPDPLHTAAKRHRKFTWYWSSHCGKFSFSRFLCTFHPRSHSIPC